SACAVLLPSPPLWRDGREKAKGRGGPRAAEAEPGALRADRDLRRPARRRKSRTRARAGESRGLGLATDPAGGEEVSARGRGGRRAAEAEPGAVRAQRDVRRRARRRKSRTRARAGESRGLGLATDPAGGEEVSARARGGRAGARGWP